MGEKDKMSVLTASFLVRIVSAVTASVTLGTSDASPIAALDLVARA
jgi:hypothetical protein